MSNVTVTVKGSLNLRQPLSGLRFKPSQSKELRDWYKAETKKDKSFAEQYFVTARSLDQAVSVYVDELLRHQPDWSLEVDADALLKRFTGKIDMFTTWNWGDGSYWCGILSYYPWTELDQDEDSVVETILRHHIFFDKKQNIFFDFNPRSPLNRWLRRNWMDSNVPTNISTIVNRVIRAMIKVLEKDDDDRPRFHKWVQSGYCSKCKESAFEDECPGCHGALVFD